MTRRQSRSLFLVGILAVVAASGLASKVGAWIPSEPGSLSSAQTEKPDEEVAESNGDDRIVPLEPLPLPVSEATRESANAARDTRVVVPLEPLASPRAPVVEPLADASPEVDIDVDGAETLLRDWAAAWSEQRVDAYLLFYSKDFRPPNGWTRNQWETQRRDRLLRPSFVKVTLDSMSIRATERGNLQAELAQAYRSDSYRDKVIKRLELTREDGLWKIVEEQVVSVVAKH